MTSQTTHKALYATRTALVAVVLAMAVLLAGPATGAFAATVNDPVMPAPTATGQAETKAPAAEGEDPVDNEEEIINPGSKLERESGGTIDTMMGTYVQIPVPSTEPAENENGPAPEDQPNPDEDITSDQGTGSDDPTGQSPDQPNQDADDLDPNVNPDNPDADAPEVSDPDNSASGTETPEGTPNPETPDYQMGFEDPSYDGAPSADDPATIDADEPMAIANVDGLTLTGGENNKPTYSNGTLTIAGRWNGYITYTGESPLTITGDGTVNASNYNTSVLTVNNSKTTVTLNGNVTLTGGKGTTIVCNGLESRGNHDFRVGGGVFVQNGEFELINGTIEKNTAQRGGGIFVNHHELNPDPNRDHVNCSNEEGALLGTGSLIMTGGKVIDNQTVNKNGDGDKYAGEGGGIFVWGTATISGGEIANNTCNSQTDLGGGGIYINNSGKATIINAKVTGNTAYGFGGGIAGCCHGESSLVATDGVALYGNTAKGTNHTMADGSKSATVAEIIDGYEGATKTGINKDNASDFYTAGSCIVSNYMVGGGSARYTVKSNHEKKSGQIEDNEVLKYEKTKDNNKVYVALKANPTDDSIKKADEALKASGNGGVKIYGNTSMVHGGGIGCNGGLYFGGSRNQTIELNVLELQLDAKKTVDGVAPTGSDFEFELLDPTRTNVIARTKNDGGIIKFNLNEYADIKEWIDVNGNSGTATFYMREVETDKNDSNIAYDKSLYEIKVNLVNTPGEEETVILNHTTDNNTFDKITVKYINNNWTGTVASVTKIRNEQGKDVSEQIKSNEIVFDNTGVGSITLTKELAFEPEGATPDSSVVDGKKYTFFLYGPNDEKLEAKYAADGEGHKKNDNVGPVTITIDGNDEASCTVEDLAPGTYTIKESDDVASIDGYTALVGENHTASVEVKAGFGASEAEITNTYQKNGKLTVTKDVVATSELTNIPADKTFKITVTLTGNGAESFNNSYEKNDGTEIKFDKGVATFDLDTHESVTFNNIPVGLSYTVTEDVDAAQVDGHTLYVSGQVTGDEEAKPIVVRPAADDSVTVTNTYKKNGELVIKKNVVDTNKEDAAIENVNVIYKFTVEGPINDPNFATRGLEVTGSGEVKLEDLTPGQYKVTEETPDGKIQNYVWNVDESITTANTAVPEGGTAEAAITNKYDEVGSLAVRKIVEGNAGNVDQEFTFTVDLNPFGDREGINGKFPATVTRSDGSQNSTEIEFMNSKASFVLKHGEVYTINDLPVGTVYNVSEEKTDYETHTYGNVVGAIEFGKVAEATFFNELSVPSGDLYLSKIATGAVTNPDEVYTFNIFVKYGDYGVTGTFGNVPFERGQATVKLKSGEHAYMTGLPVGAEYSIEEVKGEGDQSRTSINNNGVVVDGEKAEGKITEKGATVAVHYQNHNDTTTEEHKGNLTVTKTVHGVGETERDFHFTVTLTDGGSINGQYGGMTFLNGVAKFTLKDGQSLTATGLPSGMHYVVTEQEMGQDSYTTKTIPQEPNGEITEDQDQSVEYINERFIETGGLLVQKTVTGSAGSRTDKFHFKVTLDSEHKLNGQYGDMVFTDGVAEFDLSHGESMTANGLPVGTTHTVEETSANLGGYATTADGAEGQIASGTTNSASFVNDRQSGSLTVTKAVSGNNASETTDFHFTVTLGDNTINGPYGDMFFNNGVATFTLRHGQSATATGLPVNVTYTVAETEANQNGYRTSSTGASGTITDGTVAHAQFVNSRNTTPTPDPEPEPEPEPETHVGFLILHKVVAGEGAKAAANKVFTFTVTGPNGDSFTVHITGSNTVTIPNLTPGTYTVVEDDEAALVDGYSLFIEYNDEDGEGSVEVPANGAGDIIVTNTYEPENDTPLGGKGSLTITKVIMGGGDDARAKTFTFDVKDADGNVVRTVTVTGNGSIEVNDLDVGEYTVTERDANIEGLNWQVSISNGGTFTITPQGHAYITATNFYDRDDDESEDFTDIPDEPTPQGPANPTPDKPDTPDTPDEEEFVEVPDDPTPLAPAFPTYTFPTYTYPSTSTTVYRTVTTETSTILPSAPATTTVTRTVPTAPATDDTIDIADDSVPLAYLPKTGDATNLVLIASVAVIALGAALLGTKLLSNPRDDQ